MKHIQTVHRGEPLPFVSAIRLATGLSLEETELIIRIGGAYLGRRRCKQPNHLVRSGDQIAAYYRLPLELKPVAFDPNWIVADTGRYLVADKPAGLPTQGRRDADYMAFYEILKQNVRGYLGLHHRLDQDTSGLMLFARDRGWNKDIARAFGDRRIAKLYLAVTAGPWPGQERRMVINRRIATRSGPSGVRHGVSSTGKEARTEVFCLAEDQGMALVAAKPITGRTHQIRIHLADAGMPLINDRFYGGPPRPTAPETKNTRFLLHCRSLAWPTTGVLEAACFTKAVPDDWRAWLPQRFLDKLDEALPGLALEERLC